LTVEEVWPLLLLSGSGSAAGGEDGDEFAGLARALLAMTYVPLCHPERQRRISTGDPEPFGTGTYDSETALRSFAPLRMTPS
jgi:hypothetical protein